MNKSFINLNLLFLILLIIPLTFLTGCNSKKNNKTEAKVTSDSSILDPKKLYYAFGMLVGTDLKTTGLKASDINDKDLLKGLKDALGDGKTEMDLETAKNLVQQEFMKLQEVADKARSEKENKFMEENAKKSNVKKTQSGLQYEVIKEGKGPKPTMKDKVKVHYHGTLTDGTVFDSSVDRKEPIDLPLNGVIQGWQEGLQLMTVGSKYKFVIPSKLGYGNQAAGTIPANSVLVFEVELLEILK
jgi:FKBP-type peptidyl-prolyl cis-trans isomerase FklB